MLAMLTMLLGGSIATAQSVGAYLTRFDGGIGYGSLDVRWAPGALEDPDSVITSETFEGLAISLGWDLPVAPLGKEVGLGTFFALRAMMSTATSSGVYDPGAIVRGDDRRGSYEVHVNIPIGLMARYGANSWWKSELPVGAGAGLGMQFVYYSELLEYWAPIAIAEVAFTPSKKFPVILKVQYVTELGETELGEEYLGPDAHARSWSAVVALVARFGLTRQ